VEHIGLAAMDQTALFGSAGRLTSAIYESFGDIQIFDHEVAHTWGASLGADLGLLENTSGGHVHWNALSDIGGQLGAYYFSGNRVGHFSDNGDESWRFIPNSENEPYAPLELYAMGLIPPEEVPPVHILARPDLADPDRVTATLARTVAIEEIMAREGGARQPSSADTQKDFRLAYIVVQDRAFDQASYAYFSLLSYALMSLGAPEAVDNYAPFFWATGGRATLDSRLPVDVPEPIRLPGQPVASEPPPTAALSPVPPTNQPSPEPSLATPQSSPAGPPFCSLLPVGIVLGAGHLSRLRRVRFPLR
jgi:hypothetical protein